MAKYMFLQYVDESTAPRPGTPELQQQIDAFARYLEKVQAAGLFFGRDPCQPSAAGFSVTVHDGNAKISNGPMLPQSPWLNGYFDLDCKDREEAEKWAAENLGRDGWHGRGSPDLSPDVIRRSPMYGRQ